MTQDNNKKSPDKDFPGYASHPKDEDIYNQEEKIPFKEEEGKKQTDEEKRRAQDMGLDVPGSEEDDADEIIGEEDEENNYYSLGGDNHEDLEEANE